MARQYGKTTWACFLAMAAACTPPEAFDDHEAAPASIAAAAAPVAPASPARRPRRAAPSTAALAAVAIDMPASQVQKIAYGAAGLHVNDAKLDLLAAAVAALADRQPGFTQAQYTTAIAQIWTLIGEEALPPEYDQSGFEYRAIGRLLGRLVPTLGSGDADQALRAAARAYTAALRVGVDELRRVSPVDSLQDQFGAGEQFRRDAWERLVEATRAHAPLAAAVNASIVFTRLGVRTTDTPATILAAHPVEPLRSFYLAHAVADGGVHTDGAAVDTLVDTAGSLGTARSREFADNLFAMNRAEETYLRAVQPLKLSTASPQLPPLTPPLAPPLRAAALTLPGRTTGGTGDTPPSTPKSALEVAIEQAQTRQAQLKSTLTDVQSGIGGALWLAGELAKLSNDPDFAKDIEKFAKAMDALLTNLVKYSESAINAAKKLVDMLDLGVTGFQVIGAAIFTGGVIAAIFQMIAIFGASDRPDPHEVILQQLAGLRNLVQDVRHEMHNRFDRIDHKLNAIYDAMMAQFALINWELGEIAGNVEEMQAALYVVQTELDRLDRNIYTFLDTLERVPLVQGVAGYLGYFARTGAAMTYPTFAEAENLFYSWAHYHAKDGVQAGAELRPTDDSHLMSELGNYPLSTNVNYLRLLPQAKFGLAPLYSARLANPLTWIVSGESYAQLGEEWPAHQDSIASYRLDTIIDDGEAVAAGLDAVAQPALFTQLAGHYRARWNDLAAAIGTYKVAFQIDPARNLKGLGLWDPATTMPADHLIKTTKELPACRGGSFNGADTLPFQFQRYNYAAIAPFLNAGNLGLGTLTSCIDGYWMLKSSQVSDFGTFNTYYLQSIVKVRYAPAGTTTPFDVYTTTFKTNKERSKLIKNNIPFDPQTAWAYQWDIAGGSDPAWNHIYTFPVTQALRASATQRAQVEAAVLAKLDDLQRAYYAGVADRLRQAGDALQVYGQRLSSSKKMWESFIALGMPLTLAQDDHLRELLYGGEALIVATDEGDNDGLLNDVEDVYRYFSLQTEMPPTDIFPDLLTLVTQRTDELEQTMAAVVNRILTSGVPEGREPVVGTLTRLYLLQAP